VALSAQRRSGPWQRVRRGAAPPGFVPFERPPPEYEPEVADNLFWMTDPPGARFDLPSGTDHKRRVRFEKPGAYQVWALRETTRYSFAQLVTGPSATLGQ